MVGRRDQLIGIGRLGSGRFDWGGRFFIIIMEPRDLGPFSKKKKKSDVVQLLDEGVVQVLAHPTEAASESVVSKTVVSKVLSAQAAVVRERRHRETEPKAAGEEELLRA